MTQPDGILTINLRAIVRNWLRLRDRVRPARCAAVVKANAYGLGVQPVASALQRAGCDLFFVATLAEGVELREVLGGEADIVVLGGARPGAEPAFIAHRLWPSLFSMDAIERWLAAQGQGPLAPCVIKFNSGMTRLGLDAFELQALLASPEAKSLAVQIFMSHLACADEAGHPQNQQQLQAFEQVCGAAQSVWPQAITSLSNSSGIFLGRAWHQQCVRPGAALYGVNPTPGQSNPQEAVVRLALPVMQYRQLQADAAVGYGAAGQGVKGQTLAVTLGGYADGLHRQMLGRAVGELAQQRVPLVGRVAMDTLVFDVSSVSPLPVVGEAYVELLNDALTVDVLATAMGSIGYEVLTSLGARYERRYIEEGSSQP
ncbi:alanine racemase [Simiduia aestuariiviva]|uniref:Alanine racemase n=1 Tax=Simiduia aestuariiviva TaxID=1510459 RepID=A0A839UXJ3_9GAMM|nr:alanine racemase [Simiduia aestuariiviva]MBB3170168.1 alanine racemase [Simiduia aestuariiviva]